MIQISTCNISRHKDLFQVADHMVRLQNIADFKAKPLLKDGGIVELSVSTFEFPKKDQYLYRYDSLVKTQEYL